MEFIASINSFLPSETISVLNKIEETNTTMLMVGAHEIRQFKKFDPAKFYMIGVDTAPEYGADSSAIQVVDYETFEQVAEFKDVLRVDEFCKVIDIVNRVYPNNLLIVELNSYGNQVAEFLTQTGVYYNLYKQKIFNTSSNTKSTKFRYGLQTSPQTRPLMVDALYTYVHEEPEIINSERTALELIGLVQKGQRVEADQGEHDDLAFALAFCAYVKMYDPPMGMAKSALHESLAEQIYDISSWNFDTQRIYNPDIYELDTDNLEVDRVDRVDRTNKLIHKHIKNNLPAMLKDSGGIIDIAELLGFRSDTGHRDSRMRAPGRPDSDITNIGTQ